MISISNEIIALNQPVKLGVLTGKVDVKKSSDEIISLLHHEVERIEKLSLDNYRNEALIASRAVYKELGKDPSRYRISSDSLFRRVIKDKGIYYVNNVVDINNIISMRTLWSVGAYDLDKIQGDIEYGVGQDEPYEGIGRGTINIAKMPILRDEIGPFGSATSDSLRTMVTEDTKNVLMVIHAFGNSEDLQASLNDMKTYLASYANGHSLEVKII